MADEGMQTCHEVVVLGSRVGNKELVKAWDMGERGGGHPRTVMLSKSWSI
jgi:hypothetical protein